MVDDPGAPAMGFEISSMRKHFEKITANEYKFSQNFPRVIPYF